MAYTLEVINIPTRLMDVRGEAINGLMFLHTVSDHGHQPETVRDRLNDPDSRFLPIQIDGKIELVQLAKVAYFEVRGNLPEIDALKAVGATVSGVTLLLTTGEELSGRLQYEARPGSNRVLDLLNSKDSRFLVLLDDERVLFVSRDSILRAKV